MEKAVASINTQQHIYFNLHSLSNTTHQRLAMAQDPNDAADAPLSPPAIPLGLPLYDAHCHPTDTPSSLALVAGMRASKLIVMATRSQDQDLVANAAAADHGKIIAAFGWHPWFSHQLYDDTTSSDAPSSNHDSADSPKPPPASSFGDQGFKAAHYKAALTPEPSPEFIDSLPAPRRLSEYISETRTRLENHPDALVGEIGVDKAFRLPEAFTEPAPSDAPGSDTTPGGREGRRLSPYHVRIPHQVAIMTAQLRLAAEMQRAVSVHSVKAHGVVFDAFEALWKDHKRGGRRKRRQDAEDEGAEDLEFDDIFAKLYTPGPKPYPPRICLHSFSGTVEVVNQYIHPKIPASIYFSFSTVVNVDGPGASDGKFADVLKALPEDMILMESDLHKAGEEMDGKLVEVYVKTCKAKGWTVEEGVRKIQRNFDAFVRSQR
jgi:Tat protein secretion system quality control protein TatD with DNase activity